MKYLIDTKDDEETRIEMAELLKPICDELDAIDVTQPDARVRIAMVRRQLMRMAGIA